jgi:hypothetical protein
MKLQKILRTQAIVIGLGAALFLAGSVKAQDIENTVWAESTIAAPSTQAATCATANNEDAATADIYAMNFASVDATPLATEASVTTQPSQWTPSEAWLLASLLVCTALVSLYALVEAKRANRNLANRANQINE